MLRWLFAVVPAILLIAFVGCARRDPAAPLGPEKAPDGHFYTMEEREAIGDQSAKAARERVAAEAEAAARAAEAKERLHRLASQKGENFKAGVQLLKGGHHSQALAKFSQVQEVDPAYPGLAKEVAAAERMKKAEEARAEAATRKAAHENAVEERRSLGQKMRDNLLDQGFDIKVSVSGRDADRIEFTFVLFNDVWSHKFQKEGFIEELCAKGFSRIDMNSGYDWGKYWKCR